MKAIEHIAAQNMFHKLFSFPGANLLFTHIYLHLFRRRECTGQYLYQLEGRFVKMKSCLASSRETELTVMKITYGLRPGLAWVAFITFLVKTRFDELLHPVFEMIHTHVTLENPFHRLPDCGLRVRM